MSYEVKDNGTRLTYPTGAQKEVPSGKGRYDLLPTSAIHRLAQLYEKGATKYDDWNWSKGIVIHRLLDSLLRHAFQYANGDRDEDHIIAVAWNAFAIAHTEEMIKRGLLPAELDDIPRFTSKIKQQEEAVVQQENQTPLCNKEYCEKKENKTIYDEITIEDADTKHMKVKVKDFVYYKQDDPHPYGWNPEFKPSQGTYDGVDNNSELLKYRTKEDQELREYDIAQEKAKEKRETEQYLKELDAKIKDSKINIPDSNNNNFYTVSECCGCKKTSSCTNEAVEIEKTFTIEVGDIVEDKLIGVRGCVDMIDEKNIARLSYPNGRGYLMYYPVDGLKLVSKKRKS